MTIIKIGYNTYCTEKEIAPYEFSTIMGVLGQLHEVKTEWHNNDYYRVFEPERLQIAVEQNVPVVSKEQFEARQAPALPERNGTHEPVEAA